MRMRSTAAAAVLASTLWGLGGLEAPGQAQAAAARVDVPIGQLVLPNGDTRYFVPVALGGGAPIDAELDTGSFGLRVLSAALGPAQYEATDMQRNYPFGGGARFHGVLARATIAVGEAELERPALFQLVQSVDCVEQKPNCPASRISAQDYRIAGDGFARQGFNAILGISMRKAANDVGADNPLSAMGNGAWIVVLPQPGSASPGHLIINPGPDEVAPFKLIHLEQQQSRGGAEDTAAGWMDTALSGCLANEDSSERYCGRTLLDSGGPGFFANVAQAGRPTSWKQGTHAELQITGAGDPIDIAFVVGSDRASSVRIAPLREGGGESRISAGSLPYFSYAVLYDSKNGTMGFKPRGAGEP